MKIQNTRTLCAGTAAPGLAVSRGMNPTSDLKIGIIGLDTSHVLVFSDIFNNPASKLALKGARVTVAWPGGSPDIHSSISRIPGYTAELRDKFGVTIVDSPEAVAEACDAILLTSLDGRTHPGQFARIAKFGKPVFMDKPFAVSTADAKAIFATAKQHNVKLFSSSSLRFSEALVKVVTPETRPTVKGADFCGAAAHEPTNPGLYWYGIHAVEMLFTTMGRGCRACAASRTRTTMWRPAAGRTAVWAQCAATGPATTRCSGWCTLKKTPRW